MPNPNEVDVSVDGSGKVSCNPDSVTVHGRDVTLLFKVVTPGYVFPASGAIVVDNPGTQFPQGSRTLPPANTSANLLDHNTVQGTFKYTVTVQQSSTGALLREDPTIVNEP